MDVDWMHAPNQGNQGHQTAIRTTQNNLQNIPHGPNGPYYTCGQQGHFTRDCPQKPWQQQQTQIANLIDFKEKEAELIKTDWEELYTCLINMPQEDQEWLTARCQDGN